MGLYISGMEIPPKGKGVVVILCSSGAVYSGGQKVGTAVPVPPHGRLGDLDAIDSELWKMRRNYQMLDDTQTADKIMHGLYRAEQVINAAPTIIPAEEEANDGT